MKPIITEMTLCNPEDGIASEGAIIIRIEDEGGGPFLTIEGEPSEAVRLNADEVPDFVDALEDMAAICKGARDSTTRKRTRKPSHQSKRTSHEHQAN